MAEIDWTCGPLPPRDWKPPTVVSTAQGTKPPPERMALEWRKAYCLRAVEEPSVPYIRQQLRRRKRRRNWN